MKINNSSYRFLIDTGSSISLIRPETLPTTVTKVNPICIKTATGTLILDEIQEISSSVRNIILIFYTCEFGDRYDGLLGFDSLEKLNAKINIPTGTIYLNNIEYSFLTENQVLVKNNIKPLDRKNTHSFLNENQWDIQQFNKKIELHQYESIENPGNILKENQELLEANDLNHLNKPEKDSKFKLDHLNKEERQGLENLLRKYQSIFYMEGDKLTFTNAVKHKINTIHEDPIYSKTYRYPQVHRKEVDRQIQDMLNQNIICHSKSPYSAPIWVVPKKMDASGQQKWRIVIDYRKLNGVTVDDRYPIPVIDDILDKLGRCLYFTTIDLTKGFHQIEMEPSDRQKTAFSTQNGHYEFLRMPFGLKNAPATFQRLMNTILGDLIGKDCLVYMDDIIVFGTSLQEHLNSMERVFKRLADANLKIELDKSDFMRRETIFLGHVITPEGIKPNPDKVKAILNYPVPKTEKEIKQFLGLAGFYRKFIKNFSKVTKPLTHCLKKGNKINSTDKDYINAIDTIKLLITSEPILAYPNYEKLFVLTTDASNTALGAVLSQKDHPICFASRTLNEHELNYSATEKELLAIVWSTRYFRPYLYGRKFLINSDHKPLQWLHNLKEPNQKLQRWKIKLNEFDFDIKHIPGRENHVADALSRIRNENCNYNDIDSETDDANEISSVAATTHSAEEDNSSYIPITERPLNIFKNQIKIIKRNQNKIFTKKVFSNNVTTIIYKDLDTETIKDIIKTYFLNKKITLYMPEDVDFVEFQRIFSQIVCNNANKVLRSTKLLEDIKNYADFKTKILEIHLGGLHQGIEKIIKAFKTKYYFPKYVREISSIINECELCNRCKSDHVDHKLPFKITPPIYETREKYIIDFWQWDKEHYLTCIDLYSKFATAEPVKSLNWIETKKALLRVFNTMGPPKILKIDQDQGINNVNIKKWCEELNIQLEITTGKTGIGDIERLHKTLNEKLRIINTSGDKELNYFKIEQTIFTYNHNIVHSTTGETPYNIFFNKLQPTVDPQIIKERRINNINKTRKENPIDTNYLKAEVSRKRLEKINNPFRKSAIVQAEDDNEHYVVRGRNRNVRKYKSQFKRKKKV